MTCFAFHRCGYADLRLGAGAGDVPVLLVYDPRCLAHDTGPGHPERPQRLTAIHERLQADGLLTRVKEVPARAITRPELLRVHTAAYLGLVDREIAALMPGQVGVLSTGDAMISPGTATAALLSAGGGLLAADALMAGTARRAFCLLRPPGHHAGADFGMGFCIYSNVALVVRHLQQAHGLRRVLVFDFDVHHGNGTDAVFRGDASVVQFHLHQQGIYPGTGPAADTGTGAALGMTHNHPLAAKTTGAEVVALVERELPGLLRSFPPDAIVVSAGYDAHVDDPIGGLAFDAPSYAALTRILVREAELHAQGRLILCLEGGYNLPGISSSVAATITTLLEAPAAPSATGAASAPRGAVGLPP